MSTAQRQYYLNSLGLTNWKLRYPQPNANQNPNQNSAQASNSDLPSSSIDWLIQHDSPDIIFLADWSNELEFELLMAIVKACAKDRSYALGKLLSNENVHLNAHTILVFGVSEALKIAPNFGSEGVYNYDSGLNRGKVIVTYPLLELQNNPQLKKNLWKTWQQIQ